MDQSVHNRLVSFIWSIADDCLRDVYVRGKYRDVILPMVVLRRLDALLEPTKDAVLEEVRFQKEDAGMVTLDPGGLREASGYVFYNTSPFTLKSLAGMATNNKQILEENVQSYLNGFDDGVKEIVEKFKLRAQVHHMVNKGVLLAVLEKFTSPYTNLTPFEALDPDGRRLPALTNLGMGYVFEELIRKFNEENNEEAGEHFTPREVIQLMTHILFEPVKDVLPPVLALYDGACGSGGMLTESQSFITDPEGPIRSQATLFLFGKEVNDETYAICKSDMMIKGNNPEHILNGSTLAEDSFQGKRFDFMLSNPPYGKSWKGDQGAIVDGKTVIDPRFEVPLADFTGTVRMEAAIPRSSDGQLLFLMDMVSKMKRLNESPLGSRIASVHNGSSLFTGDAGGGESNIRRHIIENDWLEAIIQLPNNLFYNTGITTYIWVLANRKPAQRRGKVQLIDASELYRKLRKNLGAKNCEFAPEHIQAITHAYMGMLDGVADGNGNGGDSGQGVLRAKVFENADFGYFKATIERPQRLAAQFTPERIAPLRFVPALAGVMAWVYETWGDAIYTEVARHKKEIEAYADREGIALNPKNRKAVISPAVWKAQRAVLTAAEALMAEVGQDLFMDYNLFVPMVDEAIKKLKLKLSSGEKRQILGAVSWRDDNAARVVKKVHKLTGKKLAALVEALGCTPADLADFGYWPPEPGQGRAGEYVEYESESSLRDTENVPMQEAMALGGDAKAAVHVYFLREVRPHVDEAWIALDKTKIGYEISFNKYFYQHTPLRSLEEVTGEILALEKETEGLLSRIIGLEVRQNG